MTAAELIAALQTCPPDAQVVFFVDWDRILPVREFSPEDDEDRVVLGTEVPPELHARDYKYER